MSCRDLKMACGELEMKRYKHSVISEHVYAKTFQESFRKNWNNMVNFRTENLEIIPKPFRICKISNFIKSSLFMEELKNELSDIKSRRATIDLYQFEQTNDLANIDTENVKQLYQIFKSDLRSWMEINTKIPLNSTLSMSSSCYYDTDYLLCHDDNMGDRRIAFILYLSQNWSYEDGGCLDLFESDAEGLPRNVVKSLIPEYNSLVFFEVSDSSYHQVAEVTSDKSRWSINGWFHGPRRISNRPPRPEIELTMFEPSNDSEKLDSWIMDSYLCAGIMKSIRADVEKKSYNFLAHFLKENVYAKICQDMLSENISWIKVGPADVRNYEIADEKTLPKNLKAFYDLFKSIAFFRLLKEYTELDLVPDGKNMKPKMTIELQRWSKGSYTLICDKPTSEEDQSRVEGEKIEQVLVESGGDKMEMLVLRKRGDSACSNEIIDDEQIHLIIKGKKRKKKYDERASCSKLKNLEDRSPPFNPDSEDSEVSDIGDYLSDKSEQEGNFYTDDDIESELEPGTLDVIMQFHTGHVSEDETIDYVHPREQEGALIHIPPEDNHLCLVYKTLSTCRLQKYVNHYCEGHFYNLICTYYE